MALQSLIVSLLVGCCFVYAALNLMPQALRRLLAGALLRLPLPRSFAAYLQKAAQGSAGCGCSGCDQAPAKLAGSVQTPVPSEHVVRFHPRPRR
jgi:hypothetical protein